MKKINEINCELKEVDDIICRIEKSVLSTDTNGNEYLNLLFADSTGRIESRKWNSNNKDKTNLIQNNIIIIKNANIKKFRGMIQLKLNDYKVLNEKELSDYEMTISDLYVKAPINISNQFEKMITLLNSLKNETYKKITLEIINKYEEEFKTYPAAMSIHHNVIGGLFWHSWSLAKNCLSIKKTYEYADIDWELLICGAILHDIGKIIEIIDLNAADYSLEGKMLGHISIGNSFVYETAIELNMYCDKNKNINKDVTLLQHMILASHGKKEFGSPVEPNILEAVILSTFDDLDAKIFKINDELKKINLENWTTKILACNNKMFHKHK